MHIQNHSRLMHIYYLFKLSCSSRSTCTFEGNVSTVGRGESVKFKWLGEFGDLIGDLIWDNKSEGGLKGLFTEDSSEKLSEESMLFAEHSPRGDM